MTSFFQMIRHPQLLRRASKHDFPMPLARLAVHMYSGPRWLVIRRMIADPVTPNRGVVPGCTLACTLIKVYYIDAYGELSSTHKDVAIDVYIDDTQLSTLGSQDQVVFRLQEATTDLRMLVENDLTATLATKKAASIASSAALAKRLRSALGEDAGPSRPAAEALALILRQDGRGELGVASPFRSVDFKSYACDASALKHFRELGAWRLEN